MKYANIPVTPEEEEAWVELMKKQKYKIAVDIITKHQELFNRLKDMSDEKNNNINS